MGIARISFRLGETRVSDWQHSECTFLEGTTSMNAKRLAGAAAIATAI